MRLSLIRILLGLAALAIAFPLEPRAEPAAPLMLSVAPDGAIRASGEAPPGFSLSALRRRVPDIKISATGGDSRTPPESMMRLLDAITVVLPRLAQGTVRLSDSELQVEGTLRPGFSAEATRGAVRLALGSGWKTQIDLAEAPPPAALTIGWSGTGATVSGILPQGLSPEDALSLLGQPLQGLADEGAVDAGLTGGGGGDVATWRIALSWVGQVLRGFSRAVVKLGEGELAVDGQLEPGQDAARLEQWLAAKVADEWKVSVSGTSQPAAEGALRHDPVTGGTEKKIDHRWIPLHAFTPSMATCGRHSSAVLSSEPLTFVSGRTVLAKGAAETLDRLAGIARRCLNDGGLALEIGGHTDSRGDAAENLALSKARAMEVLLQLALRGVRADAMHAVGFGESRAIAGNDTPAGRARNRRITFAWSK